MRKFILEGVVSWRWFVTRIELRLADVAMLLPVAVLLLAPTYFEPMWGGSDDGTSRVLILALASLLGIVGRTWIRRIARGNPEPEANDQFWWSRT